MPDVSVTDAATPHTQSANFRPEIVWVSRDVAYYFFIAGSIGLRHISYVKTLDGGATWGPEIVMDPTTNGNNPFGMSVFYERWTPGRPDDVIHVSWGFTVSGSTPYASPTVLHMSLDVGTDTISGPHIVETNVLWTGGQNFTGCLTRGGALILAAEIDPFFPSWKSIDGGITWSSIADFWKAKDDGARIFPAGRGKPNAVWGVYPNSNSIVLRVYDPDVDSWSEAVISTTPPTWRFDGNQVAGVVKHSTGKLQLALVEVINSAGLPISYWEIGGLIDITQKTAVVLSSFGVHDIAMTFVQHLGHAYVAFLRAPAGSPGTNPANVIYRKSEDSGLTWLREIQFSEDTGINIVDGLHAGGSVDVKGGRFSPVWFDDTAADAFTNFSNSIVIETESDVVGSDGLSGEGPFEALLAVRGEHLATLWTIARTDGVVFRFTDHNEPLEFEENTFKPVGSLSASARQRQAGFRADNLEAFGVIDDDSITHDDLRAGRYREAEITEQLVDWRWPWVGALLTNKYWIEELRFSGERWTAEIAGMSQWLRQPTGDVYGRTCQHDLGDDRCRVDLTDPSFSVSNASVTAVIKSRVKFYTDVAGFSDNDFALGHLTWVSGLNASLVFPIKVHLQANGEIELQLNTPFDIVVGDTFSATMGCDKLKQTCIEKFDNILNHGGDPYIPGADRFLETPNSQ